MRDLPGLFLGRWIFHTSPATYPIRQGLDERGITLLRSASAIHTHTCSVCAMRKQSLPAGLYRFALSNTKLRSCQKSCIVGVEVCDKHYRCLKYISISFNPSHCLYSTGNLPLDLGSCLILASTAWCQGPWALKPPEDTATAQGKDIQSPLMRIASPW